MLEKMLKESENIFDYSSDVSLEYEKHSKAMLEYVNYCMREEDNIIDLIGDNSFSFMDNNHENHIHFMKNIISFKQKDLLLNTLPWVYKAYSSKGVDFEYFKVELNYWIKAIEKYVNEDAQLPLIKIYEQMLDWHERLIEISNSESISTFKLDIVWTESHEEILKSLITGDFRSLLKISSKILDDGMNVIDFYVNFLQTAMYKVGELWENGEITVAHEHLATSTIARVMSSIYPKYILCENEKGIALVSASVNEYHQIGARMVADALESNGWDIRYLGANVPIKELIQLVEEIKPKFVALSMTMSYHTDEMMNTVKEIKANISTSGVKIMVGGLAINKNIELQHLIGADAYPKTADESIAIAAKWWLDGN